MSHLSNLLPLLLLLLTPTTPTPLTCNPTQPCPLPCPQLPTKFSPHHNPLHLLLMISSTLHKFCFDPNDRSHTKQLSKEFEHLHHLPPGSSSTIFDASMSAALSIYNKEMDLNCDQVYEVLSKSRSDNTNLTLRERMLPRVSVDLVRDELTILAKAGETSISASNNSCEQLVYDGVLSPQSLNACISESIKLIDDLRGHITSFDDVYMFEADVLACKSYREGDGKIEGGTIYYPYKFTPLRNLMERAVGGKGGNGMVCEVGFNMGHSSLIWLLYGGEGVKVISFDLGEHPYSRRAKEYLYERFPGRIEVVFGDSTESIEKYDKPVLCDVIFVDGGHEEEVAYSDIKSMKRFAGNNTVLIVDDINQDSVEMAWERAKAEGIVEGHGEVYEDAFFGDSRGSRSAIVYGMYLF